MSVCICSRSVAEELWFHCDRTLISARSTAAVDKVLEVFAQIFIFTPCKSMSLAHFTYSGKTACRLLVYQLCNAVSPYGSQYFSAHFGLLKGDLAFDSHLFIPTGIIFADNRAFLLGVWHSLFSIQEH